MQQMIQLRSHDLEDELRDMLNSPDTLELLDECVLDGLWFWDLENPEHEYMSPGFWKTLGFEPSEKRHLSSEWMDLIFPEDLKVAQAAASQHLKNSEYPYDQIVRYKTKTGAPVTIRCRGKAILRNGVPVRLFGAHTVVSDQKRTAIEQRVDLMMRQSHDAVISWTDETGVQTWNKGAEVNYGVPEADAIGKNPFELSNASLPEPWADMRRHLETGEDWLGEISHTLQNGDEMLTATRISAQKLEDGRMLFLKISRDETRRIVAEQRNSILLRELKHRVRNLFAVVQSITRLSARTAKDIPSFAASLQHRIGALAAAHTTGMSEDDSGPTHFKDVLKQVLLPYFGDALQIEHDTKDVLLSDDSLTPISLLINEFATNAVKYGAWSKPGGRVDLKWIETTVDGIPSIQLAWTETLPDTMPAFDPETFDMKPGFGSLLIENSARQVGGTFKRELKGHQLCITLTFPT